MKMKLLGISLQYMDVKGALKKTDSFLKTGSLKKIAYISAKKLVEASESEDQKRWLEKMDLIVCEDIEVYKAANLWNKSRAKAVEEMEYLQAVLKRMVKNEYGVFLLSDTQENLVLLEEKLRTYQPDLLVVGKCATDQYETNMDSMINAMNLAAPKAILSKLPYPLGLDLMDQYHNFLNSSIWISLPEGLELQKKSTLGKKMSQWLYHWTFRKKISKFDEK